MKEILIGSNYYPEDWDPSEMDADIAKMKECGFNVARIGEFAWKKDEPEEGKFDLSWLHRAVDKLGEAGIKVIMGTPTATPPSWLYKKYPDMAMLGANGIRQSHGGRRHCCSSNPDYRRYSAKIVEELAREFGDDPFIIGWQIDNEIYPKDGYCVCPHCMDNFHKHLREKYGTVEKINRAWNLNLFSQAYDSIEDIPAPFNTWHNPHILLEWKISQAKNHVDFVHMQADILKKYTSAPIGTDTMPLNGIDYRDLNSRLDVAQYNHYNTPANILHSAMWIDYMRKFSRIPLWNTETQPCWNGSTAQGMNIPPENYIYFNTWLPIMLGGEANIYWLWRTHWAGHELMHGAVLDSCGRYTHTNGEIRRAARDFKKAEKQLTESTPVSDSALIFTNRNWDIQRSQTVNKDLKTPEGTNCLQTGFYKAMLKASMHPDVIDAREDLSSYKLVFAPCAFTLDEGNFGARVTEWVKNGGVFVAGPLTDVRTSIGTKYKDSPYGFLEALTGARLKYTLPNDGGMLTVENEDGEEVSCSVSYELYEGDGLEHILTVTGGHSALVGLPCAASVKVGKGRVILLGTFPEDRELDRIIRKAASLSGARTYDASEGLLITEREGDSPCIIAAAADGRESRFCFEGRMRDVLTDTVFDGNISLSPYSVAVLVKE